MEINHRIKDCYNKDYFLNYYYVRKKDKVSKDSSKLRIEKLLE